MRKILISNDDAIALHNLCRECDHGLIATEQNRIYVENKMIEILKKYVVRVGCRFDDKYRIIVDMQDSNGLAVGLQYNENIIDEVIINEFAQ